MIRLTPTINVDLTETEINEIVINSRKLAMDYMERSSGSHLENWEKAVLLEAAVRLNKIAAKLESSYDSGSF